MENAPLFNTSLEHSYKCFKKQTFNLTQNHVNVTASFIHLQHVQLQAFRNTTGTVFAEGKKFLLNVLNVKFVSTFFKYLFMWTFRSIR